MYCKNCPTVLIPDGQDNDIFHTASLLNSLLQKSGIPTNLRDSDSELHLLDRLVNCCDNPDIRWEEVI